MKKVKKNMVYVYVISKDRKPLMPTTRCGHVRKLLKAGLAVPICNNPFTIRLKYDTPNEVQELYLGIDTGRENIGLGVTKENGDGVYIAELQTNNKSVKRNMDNRRECRKSRRQHNRQKKQRKAIRTGNTIQKGDDDVLRSKKPCKSVKMKYPKMEKTVTHKVIRGAEPQYCNRKRPDGWLTPSAIQCIQMNLIPVEKTFQIMPITDAILERVNFDFQKLENESIEDWQYGQGPLYGFKDYKEYINEVQHGVCLLCGKAHIEHYHHIVQRKDNGGDNVENIAGLCSKCHKELHNIADVETRLKELKAGAVKKYSIGLLNSAMPTLIDEMRNLCNRYGVRFHITAGDVTAKTRELLNLPKRHGIDAICISLASRLENGTIVLDKNKESKDSSETKISLPSYIYHLRRFKKKSKNYIIHLNSRKYYAGETLVATNRKKAMDQKENSLQEYMEEYALTHTKEECEEHLHSLKIKPAKREYTYHKAKKVAPIHVGDVVLYERKYKNGKIEREIFVAESIKISTNTVCYGTKCKNLKYCKRLESGCIQTIGKEIWCH